MSERQEQFEKMLQAVQEQYAATVERLAVLKEQDKTKTATYRQLLGDKLTLQNILSLYKIYGPLDRQPCCLPLFSNLEGVGGAFLAFRRETGKFLLSFPLECDKFKMKNQCCRVHLRQPENTADGRNGACLICIPQWSVSQA